MVIDNFYFFRIPLTYEKRCNNGAEIVFLEHISDCLRCDRVGNDVVDEVDSLNSIINLSSSDLV